MSIGTHDLHMCMNSSYSHFVQTGRMRLVQVDLLPFLTQSQVNGGFDKCWFSNDHFQETLMLLKPLLEACVEPKDSAIEKPGKSKDCIFTGESVRVACTLKPLPQHSLCLITQFGSHRKLSSTATAKKNPTLFQEMTLHREKVVAYVCPRASSSHLQLSQLVCNEAEKGRNVDDISKYFISSEAASTSSSTHQLQSTSGR